MIKPLSIADKICDTIRTQLHQSCATEQQEEVIGLVLKSIGEHQQALQREHNATRQKCIGAFQDCIGIVQQLGQDIQDLRA